ncbi:MAG: FAD-binding protein [Rhodobacteraceae bacterium]|nr:FAD-binding protein [Paracoccaceae bacterium]
MAHVQNLSKYSQKIVVVGAGIGGLAAALRLSTLGHKVRIIEAAPTPGGKIRTLSGANNPIDLGPTVLTLLPVFERLFSDVGENLHNHISVTQQHVLARHWWRDGTCLGNDQVSLAKCDQCPRLNMVLQNSFQTLDCNNCLGDTRHMSGACHKPRPRSCPLFGKPRQKVCGRSMAECTNSHASSKRSASNAGLNLPTTAALSRSKNRKKQQHK